MARRRFQDPTPKRRGAWWTIQLRQDVFVGGKLKRKNKRVRLAPASMPERQVRKIATEYLRPLNQDLQDIGSTTNFAHYIEYTYRPVVMPLFAKSTRDRYEGVLENYLLPTFGGLSLRDITPLSAQRYFSNMSTSPLARESRDKVRDVGLGWVNWRGLRTSHAVWLKMAGADVKDAQGQMRHSRASTTLDIYQQFVSESQQRVVEKLSSLSNSIN